MIGVKAKFCPTERSNSPQIMSMVTPMATMPMVDATVVIAVIVCGDQKFGVCSVKNSTTPSRPKTGRKLAHLQQRLEERYALAVPGQRGRRRHSGARRIRVHELCVADRCQGLGVPRLGPLVEKRPEPET